MAGHPPAGDEEYGMRYCFDAHELDLARGELRSDGLVVPVEPRVFALLSLLVEQRDRLVTREELIEKVWDGRVVSDAALASCLKSARRALGDDGQSQRYLRTVHGRGVRFVGTVDSAMIMAPGAGDEAPALAAARAGRPSLAVLPFELLGPPAPLVRLLPEALPHELIAALARLRWLFVIARGSSFRFRAQERDVVAAGRALGVRYVLTGSVASAAGGVAVIATLVDSTDGGVLWSERAEVALDDIHALRTQLVARVVGALELQIPLHEAQRARLTDPTHIDAWGHYHLGLQHGWRFNAVDNRTALACFERAIACDPHFARAHAGLSFAYFQNAFLRYSADPAIDARAARASAEEAVALDSADPFANFTLGRSLWLDGNLDGSLVWLERATQLSPNYAQGHYARAWAQTLVGDAAAGRANADLALALSPFDPLAYAMLGTRALSHAVLGEYAQAAHYAERAARAPGAHVLIAMIAGLCHSLAGAADDATRWRRSALERRPDLSRHDFLRAFPFADPAIRRLIDSTLADLGW